MIKRIEEKANKLGTMYVTENPINFDDRYFGMKYFICFHNTNKIVSAFKTQNELEKEIDDILENGVQQDSHSFY